MNRLARVDLQRLGPWALVTGASDGIGLAFARELAAQGMNLLLVARRADVLKTEAAELTRLHRVDCRVLAVDLSQPEAVNRVVAESERFDVGLLVAAAGFGTSGPFTAADIDEERALLAVNCDAVMTLCWHFARRLSQRGRGGLVLMSSLLAFHGVPRSAHYAASKAYVQSLAEGLRAELAPQGVDVIAVAPGPTHTGFATRARMNMPRAERPEVVARQALRALGHQTTVRPGALSKLLGWSLAMLPRWAQVKLIGQVMQGMTSHQESPAA